MLPKHAGCYRFVRIIAKPNKPMSKKTITSFVAGMLITGLFAFTASEYQVRKNTAEVDQSEGLYIFHQSRPVQEYEVLGVMKPGVVTMNNKYETLRNSMVKRARKEYPKADAVIINDEGDKADVVKFK